MGQLGVVEVLCCQTKLMLDLLQHVLWLTGRLDLLQRNSELAHSPIRSDLKTTRNRELMTAVGLTKMSYGDVFAFAFQQPVSGTSHL